MPVVATVTVVEQAPEAIAAVPRAVVPEANVVEIVPDAGKVAVELIPVPPFVRASNPVTWVARLMTVTAPSDRSARAMMADASFRFIRYQR